MKHRRTLSAVQKPMARWSWFFLLPMVAAFAIGFVWPFLQGVYLSFCKFRLISICINGSILKGNVIKHGISLKCNIAC